MTEYFFEEWSNDSFMDSGMAIPTYPKRLGILATALILQTYSDETRLFTQNMLVGWLADFGIACDRKTVGRNIAFLREIGYPIVKTPRGFYMSGKQFTVEETQFIMQAVREATGKSEEGKAQLLTRLEKLICKIYRRRK